jgi:hypothetical protein
MQSPVGFWSDISEKTGGGERLGELLSEGWEVLSERSGSEAAPITVRLMEISKFGNLEYPEELPDLLGRSSTQAPLGNY